MAIDHFPLILLFPLLGVLVNAVLGKRLSLRASGGLASLMVLLSFAVAVQGFLALRGATGESARLVFTLWEWIGSGDLRVDFSLLLDPLSSLMILVVTGVGFLIHVYCIGYMAHERGLRTLLRLPEPLHAGDAAARAGRQLPRPLRRLGGRGPLLLPAHRLLVRAHVHGHDVDGQAGKKAFIVNRIGDFGFLIALFLIFTHFAQPALRHRLRGGPAATRPRRP